MILRTLLVAAVLLVAMVGSTASAEPVSSDVSTGPGEERLHGTLIVPDSDLPVPVAFILPGSGPTDRDGNQPGFRQDAYRLLAEGLAGTGIASLRIDKRGVGASKAAAPASESALTVDTFLSDILDWIRFLEADDRFTGVTLLGHSEGALFAILAAGEVPVSSVVLLAGLGRPAAEVIRWQLRQLGLPAALRDDADGILAALAAGRTVAEPPEDLAALFRPGVQPYMTSWLAIDPAERLSRLDVPVLVLHGETDLQVPVEEARTLAAARDGIDLVILEDVNHILRRVASGDRAANLATYSRPDIPIADNVVPPVAAFIRRHDR